MIKINEQELRTIIANGENENVEFKTVIPNNMVLAKQIASFANCNGGYILIGVSDNKEIVGSVAINESILREIPLKNIPQIEIYSLEIDGKTVNIIIVEKQTDGFTTCNGQLYSRSGESNQLMTLSQIECSLRRNQYACSSIQNVLAEMNQKIESLKLESEESSKKSNRLTIVWSVLGALIGAILGFVLGLLR